MYAALAPDIVIHLAAVVGGIGASRDRPAGSSSKTSCSVR
jgi:hypothetical protein